MKLADVEITDNGVTASVVVNGVDLSDCLQSISYTHQAQELPILTLNVYVENLRINSACTIRLPKAIMNSLSQKQKDELLAGEEQDDYFKTAATD